MTQETVNRTSGTSRHADPLDRAAEVAHQMETQALDAALLAHRQRRQLHAIVVKRSGRLTKLLTRCGAAGRQSWVDGYFGLDPAVCEDLDALWGVAWFDADGTVHTAGNDLGIKQMAQAMLLDPGLQPLEGDLMITLERPTGRQYDDLVPMRQAFFAYSTVLDGEPVVSHDLCRPNERQGVLELR